MNKIHHPQMLKKTLQFANLLIFFPTRLMLHCESQSCCLRVTELSSAHALFVTCFSKSPLFFFSILAYTLGLKSTTHKLLTCLLDCMQHHYWRQGWTELQMVLWHAPTCRIWPQRFWFDLHLFQRSRFDLHPFQRNWFDLHWLQAAQCI